MLLDALSSSLISYKAENQYILAEYILREQERNLNPTKSPPPLLLDGLRMYIDGAVERFLSRKGLREDSSGVNFDWYS